MEKTRGGGMRRGFEVKKMASENPFRTTLLVITFLALMNGVHFDFGRGRSLSDLDSERTSLSPWLLSASSAGALVVCFWPC